MRLIVTSIVIVIVAAVAVVAQAPPGRLPAGIHSGTALQTVPDKWMWHMGMLRGLYEVDGVVALEIKKSTGTVRVGGQPCTLANYRASINYWLPGLRAQYTMALPSGAIAGERSPATPEARVVSRLRSPVSTDISQRPAV